MNKYELIILCGKAGAGKDYLLQKVKERYGDKLNYIISDTTRPKRYGETDGVAYHFLSDADFHTKDHLETTFYETDQGVWYYGTPLSALDLNKINIGVFNIDGINKLYENDNLNLHIFLICASDRTRLLRQMSREEYPNYVEICRRFLADEKDFKNILKYPVKRIKNSPELAKNQCEAILFDEIDQLLADFSRMS